MEEYITIAVIKETGYNTWRSFYFHQTSYSSTNDVQYLFGCSILKMLVLEESKILLRYLNLKSFTELLEKKDSLIKGSFDFDVVVIDEDENVSYKKISISLNDAVRLSDIEKSDFPYIVFEKKIKSE